MHFRVQVFRVPAMVRRLLHSVAFNAAMMRINQVPWDVLANGSSGNAVETGARRLLPLPRTPVSSTNRRPLHLLNVAAHPHRKASVDSDLANAALLRQHLRPKARPKFSAPHGLRQLELL